MCRTLVFALLGKLRLNFYSYLSRAMLTHNALLAIYNMVMVDWKRSQSRSQSTNLTNSRTDIAFGTKLRRASNQPLCAFVTGFFSCDTASYTGVQTVALCAKVANPSFRDRLFAIERSSTLNNTKPNRVHESVTTSCLYITKFYN